MLILGSIDLYTVFICNTPFLHVCPLQETFFSKLILLSSFSATTLLTLTAYSGRRLCVLLVSVCPSVCLSRRSITVYRLLIDICRRQTAAAASVIHCDPRDKDRQRDLFFWGTQRNCCSRRNRLMYMYQRHFVIAVSADLSQLPSLSILQLTTAAIDRLPVACNHAGLQAITAKRRSHHLNETKLEF